MDNYPNPARQPRDPYAAPGAYGYAPGAYDYNAPLPAPKGPNMSLILTIAAVAVLCLCCGLLIGIVIGIELPGLMSAPTPIPDTLPPAESWRPLLAILQV